MGMETLIGGGLKVAGSLLGGSSSKKAANAQEDSVNKSLALQKEMFDKQIELNEPFRQGGLTGQNRLMELLGLGGNAGAQGYGSAMKDFGMADFQADPGYQWRIEQGQKARERSAAARGGLLSGGALKDANDYGQGMASQEYTNAFNRFQTNRANKLNPLQSLAGLGQTVAGQMGQAGQSYANEATKSIQGAGNARASGYIGQGNAINNGLSSIGNAYQDDQNMNRLMSGGGLSGSGYATGRGTMDELTGYGVF